MKHSGDISILFFLISLMVFGMSFFNGDLFSGPVMIFLSIVLPLIGFIVALVSKSGRTKVVGLIGNTIIFIGAGVIPAVSTLFWNKP
ncbi:hypothetical protein [Bacillus vallismortis]|uniref:hypothetical protein n=1 Tax=Bacillus vallismortis TaxID=72361 RepID=UPI0020908D6B|nr:hypothetical protein [Bacillus vallismortis]MCO4850035.1 hypothetical protein [Bacillus vallismortis]